MKDLLDFMLDEEQIALREMIHEFAVKEIRPVCKETDITGEYPFELLKKAQDMGLTTMSLPVEFGGMGIGAHTYAICREEVSWGDAGFASSLSACFLGAMPCKVAGTKEQLQHVADVLLNGGLTAFGLTEPQAGSDSAALTTSATKDGDDYILNGRKCFITNGGIADLYTIFATVDKSLGAKGVTAFMVDRNTPGFSVGKKENKMGIRTANTCDLILEDVRVPAKNIIGEVGGGFKVAMGTLDRTRPTSGSGAVGVARAAFEHAVEYSKQRVTFGKPICKNQAIQFMLADMDIQINAARQLVWAACKSIDSGIVNSKLASSAKCFAGDMCVQVTLDAVQILGGYGYSRDYPVEKLLRDAKNFQILEGTNQIQRKIVAGQILK